MSAHRRTARRARRRTPRRAWLLVVAGIAMAALGTPSALGGFTAKVVNSNDTAQSSIFPCSAAAVAASAYFTYPLNEASGTTVADVSGNNRPGTYGPSGITYGASGPCAKDGGRAITLDGTSGYATGPSASMVGPNLFSVAIWFRTTTTTGGKLIGFGSSATGSSGSYDRHLFMTDAGKIVMGVYPNAVKVVTSPASYNDGSWHLAVGTLAPVTNANPGLRLYVDGSLVASDLTTTTAQSFTGYWRIGYDNTSGWTSQPSSFFFKGSLAWAQLYLTALTPAQVTSLYTASTS